MLSLGQPLLGIFLRVFPCQHLWCFCVLQISPQLLGDGTWRVQNEAWRHFPGLGHFTRRLLQVVARLGMKLAKFFSYLLLVIWNFASLEKYQMILILQSFSLRGAWSWSFCRSKATLAHCIYRATYHASYNVHHYAFLVSSLPVLCGLGLWQTLLHLSVLWCCLYLQLSRAFFFFLLKNCFSFLFFLGSLVETMS